MLRIINSHTDPYFNIALEEYLLKNLSEECFMLWHSEPSVVIGKHQNALAEINYPYVLSKGIKVVRRISGGGTVFHGPGNLNFTFIRKGVPGKMIDFRKHTEPVIGFLNDLGIPARFEGKNDIRVNGLKVSGNAEHIFKNRVLHHGTLLVNAKLETLKEAIRVRPDRYTDKSIQSVRSHVANISEFTAEKIAFDQLMLRLGNHLESFFGKVEMYTLDDSDKEQINKLINEKYALWEWNYGYSPDYIFQGETEMEYGRVKLNLQVKNGRIASAVFSGADLPQYWHNLSRDMQGKYHQYEEIIKLVRNHKILQNRDTDLTDGLFPLFF